MIYDNGLMRWTTKRDKDKIKKERLYNAGFLSNVKHTISFFHSGSLLSLFFLAFPSAAFTCVSIILSNVYYLMYDYYYDEQR